MVMGSNESNWASGEAATLLNILGPLRSRGPVESRRANTTYAIDRREQFATFPNTSCIPSNLSLPGPPGHIFLPASSPPLKTVLGRLSHFRLPAIQVFSNGQVVLGSQPLPQFWSYRVEGQQFWSHEANGHHQKFRDTSTCAIESSRPLLPRWLDVEVLTAFSINCSKSEPEKVEFTTDVIEKGFLFHFIKRTQFRNLTPKQYRAACESWLPIRVQVTASMTNSLQNCSKF